MSCNHAINMEQAKYLLRCDAARAAISEHNLWFKSDPKADREILSWIRTVNSDSIRSSSRVVDGEIWIISQRMLIPANRDAVEHRKSGRKPDAILNYLKEEAGPSDPSLLQRSSSFCRDRCSESCSEIPSGWWWNERSNEWTGIFKR
jgi:hypothetical protein